MSTEAEKPSIPCPEPKPAPPQDQLAITQHQVTIGGQRIAYTVTTGTLVLKEEAEKKGEKAGEAEGEKPKASIFFIAYTRDDVSALEQRPLTFSFNGGPGSSSVWLHLGVLGPRRVLMDDSKEQSAQAPRTPEQPLPPPFRLSENEFSLLDVTDLVFIDPVSTGYSRPVPGEKARDFHGFTKDLATVGDFIRLYTTRHKRWLSPKFLIGESYGTTRACGLAGYLQERHGMFLNGLMLISSILDFQTARFDAGNDLPYILFLPTYTATAWYHGRLEDKLQADLQATLREVETFASGDYAAALFKGETLSAKDRARIVKQLARYTGLSPTYIEATNLRINIHRFTKELLRDQWRTVGRLDSRFQGIDRDAAGAEPDNDPSLTNVIGPYTSALNHYVRADLQFESDLPYEILNEKVWPWSYASHENQYVNVAETLRKAFSINPFLQVYVANGYYDLATPYFATEYTFNHLGIDSALRANLRMGYYEAGHMMYTHRPSLAKMKTELTAFIQAVVGKQ